MKVKNVSGDERCSICGDQRWVTLRSLDGDAVPCMFCEGGGVAQAQYPDLPRAYEGTDVEGYAYTRKPLMGLREYAQTTEGQHDPNLAAFRKLYGQWMQGRREAERELQR